MEVSGDMTMGEMVQKIYTVVTKNDLPYSNMIKRIYAGKNTTYSWKPNCSFDGTTDLRFIPSEWSGSYEKRGLLSGVQSFTDVEHNTTSSRFYVEQDEYVRMYVSVYINDGDGGMHTSQITLYGSDGIEKSKSSISVYGKVAGTTNSKDIIAECKKGDYLEVSTSIYNTSRGDITYSAYFKFCETSEG